MKGQIYIEANVDSQPLILTSDDLIIFLDREEASFKYILDPITLDGVNSKYKKRLKALNSKIVIEGDLGVQSLPQTDHPPIKTDVDAYSQTTSDTDLKNGHATLRYTHSQRFDSLLKMYLTFESGALGLTEVFDISSDEINVTIKHPVIHGHI